MRSQNLPSELAPYVAFVVGVLVVFSRQMRDLAKASLARTNRQSQ